MEQLSYSKQRPWKILIYLFLFQLVVAFSGRSLPPLGAIIGEDLQLSLFEIGLIPSALFLGQSIVSIPSGMLTDKVGSKKMMLLITLLLSGSFLAMSFTTTFPILLILIIFSGLAYGASHPTTNRGILYWFQTTKRGTAMGIKQMGVTLGSALAALLLLPLAKQTSWQFSLLVAVFSMFLIGMISYFTYHEPTQFNQSKKSESPGNFRKVLTNVGLILVTIGAVLLSGSQMILNTFIVIFAHKYLGFSLSLATILLVVSEVGGSLGRVSWGLISDRLYSGKRVIVLLLISLFVGFLSILFAFIPLGTPYYLFAIIVFLFGFCTSGFNGIWMNATTEMVHHSMSGVATGISITFGSLGAVLFPPIFGAIVDWTSSYSFSWLFVTLLMIISVILLFYCNRSYNV